MMGFTIVGEFSCYSPEDVFKFSDEKLQLLYKEALRVRASKATLLAQLINLPHQDKDKQSDVGQYLKKLLHPHILTLNTEIREELIEAGWGALRSRVRVK